jgi:hypothetical protein
MGTGRMLNVDDWPDQNTHLSSLLTEPFCSANTTGGFIGENDVALNGSVIVDNPDEDFSKGALAENSKKKAKQVKKEAIYIG